MTQLDKFDRLLEAMPKIAESVNSFSSKDVQRSAFDALIAALGVKVHTTTASPVGTPTVETPADSGAETKGTEAAAVPEAASNGSTPRKARKASGSKKNFVVPKGLNFAPEGTQSLEDFVKEKQPSSLFEKNLVAVHYLTEIMDEAPVDVGKVLAVYQAAGWSASTQPDKSLQNTASAEGWIDTANMKDIKVVWAGTNQLNKMPVAKDTSKA